MRQRKIDLFTVVNVMVLALVGFLSLYPFWYMIVVSLSSSEHVIRNEVFLFPKGFTLDIYQYVLQDKRIWTGYKNTIIYTVLGTFLSLMLTAMGAYSLSRANFVFKKFFMLMIVFTIVFNGGMIPTFLVVRSLGVMDTIWAMVIPGLISTWNLIIMRTFFQGIPHELVESGKIDGLNDLGVFTRIILPLSKSVLATIGLFYAVGIWNNFFHALLYLRNADLFPLQVFLRNIVLAGQVQDGTFGGGGDGEMMIDESLKFATIMVSTLPIIMVYPFLQKYFVKGVLIGSLKG
ncbi:carbohydrate ABC transporter permease [Paenibacillus sp. J2TS4]|uniref:carbohydrate ABC transporter permease n=1 Tax=Paenibacillus sp. J2TS4 TaxID=2807194 RepID=UPI001B1502DF|nr:carbohydrate ABC transporter permease [Paenibacillus sp. J2TS4]GIP33994.1 ABC transporter permease [Paenibacillus sp. J2TS4]